MNSGVLLEKIGKGAVSKEQGNTPAQFLGNGDKSPWTAGGWITAVSMAY